MGTSKPLVVVAVVEDDAASRTALGRVLQAAGVEPLLFESADADIEASCRASSCDGNILTATIASVANR